METENKGSNMKQESHLVILVMWGIVYLSIQSSRFNLTKNMSSKLQPPNFVIACQSGKQGGGAVK